MYMFFSNMGMYGKGFIVYIYISLLCPSVRRKVFIKWLAVRHIRQEVRSNDTVSLLSLDPFELVSYFINWVKAFWTYSIVESW